MRVLVNGISALGGKTGVGHYTAQLLRCLREQAAHEVIESFAGPWVGNLRHIWQRFRAGAMGESASRRGANPAASAGAPRSDWRTWCFRRLQWLRQRWLERELHGRGPCDLYHEPNHIPLATDLPTVATVHDLSALLHPDWHPVYRATEHQARFLKGLALCRHVLAVSEFTRQELIHKVGLRPDQVTRTYNGVRPGLGPMPKADVQAVLRRLGLPPRYFLYLGTIEPRKNVLTLLRAYVKLPAEVRERCPLVLAGGWGWNSADVAAFLHEEARHRNVLYTGYLPEEHLAAVLNGARALVYPSFYEGFGLPPVEMMACGGAVLCSKAGALVETVGARAHLVEARDEDGWREAMHRAAVDDDWIAELKRGAVDLARPFTWERCAADTLAVYRTACGQSASGAADLRKAG